MSKSGFTTLTCLLVLASGAESFGQVRVKGYTRKDGTYVAPHVRSRPDGNPYNNWSTDGNYNPYTGKAGTKAPTPYYPATASPTSSSRSSVPAPPAVGQEPPLVALTRAPDDSPVVMVPQAAGPPFTKTALLQPPSPLSRSKGWQILFTDPLRSVFEELYLVGTLAFACTSYSLLGCRPVTVGHPVGPGEQLTDRAILTGAVNRVSGKLEVWGYATVDA